MNQTRPKRLYRSRKQRMVAGVAGGIGEFLGIDPKIVRVLWIVGTLVLPPTIPASVALYIILAILIPEEPAGL